MREVLIRSDAVRPYLEAVLGPAIAFRTWRALVGERGLEESAAVDLMVQAVTWAPRGAPHGSDR